MSVTSFRYRISLLNVAAAIYLLTIAVFSWINWEILSSDEGWGVVYMFALAIAGIVALLVNLLLQIIFRNRRYLLIADSIALAAFVVFFLTVQ